MSDLITFPPGVLGPDPIRLPVLARGAGWFALDKPAGLPLAPDALHAEDAPSIVAAIHAAALAGKPQLTALGITGCARIHSMDAEIAGAAVLADAPEVAADLRNTQGSGRWSFAFHVVAEAGAAPAQFECDLPLVRHSAKPRMLVSHREGKRCLTRFTLVQQLGRHALWEAVTHENRLHQIRVHAAESGLRIPGESLYGRVPQIYLSAIKRRYRRGTEDERPLHPGLPIHLRRIDAAAGTGSFSVESPQPKHLATLIRRLGDQS